MLHMCSLGCVAHRIRGAAPSYPFNGIRQSMLPTPAISWTGGHRNIDRSVFDIGEATGEKIISCVSFRYPVHLVVAAFPFLLDTFPIASNRVLYLKFDHSSNEV